MALIEEQHHDTCLSKHIEFGERISHENIVYKNTEVPWFFITIITTTVIIIIIIIAWTTHIYMDDYGG